MFDYETLRVIWWLLLGTLLIGFAITDGFDLGVGAIFRFVGRTDEERRALLESVEPVWEGNQVWFILAGGAVFAAWPLLYAASFSGLYLAMFLILVAFILRPVGFTYRNKLPDARWRNAWDFALLIGGAVPALLFGVAFGNLFLGVPFHFDELQRPVYTAGFFNLLHPYALRGNPFDPSNPLGKTVVVTPGTWLAHFREHGVLWLAPGAALLGAAAAAGLLARRRAGLAFVASCITEAGTILTAGIALFPFLMPSSTHPAHGLTIWDASTSEKTLGIMLIAVIVFLPIVLMYTAWVFRVLRGRITLEEIRKHVGLY